MGQAGGARCREVDLLVRGATTTHPPGSARLADEVQQLPRSVARLDCREREREWSYIGDLFLLLLLVVCGCGGGAVCLLDLVAELLLVLLCLFGVRDDVGRGVGLGRRVLAGVDSRRLAVERGRGREERVKEGREHLFVSLDRSGLECESARGSGESDARRRFPQVGGDWPARAALALRTPADSSGPAATTMAQHSLSHVWPPSSDRRLVVLGAHLFHSFAIHAMGLTVMMPGYTATARRRNGNHSASSAVQPRPRFRPVVLGTARHPTRQRPTRPVARHVDPSRRRLGPDLHVSPCLGGVYPHASIRRGN